MSACITQQWFFISTLSLKLTQPSKPCAAGPSTVNVKDVKQQECYSKLRYVTLTLNPHWVSLTLSPMTIMTSKWKPRISMFLQKRSTIKNLTTMADMILLLATVASNTF